MTDREYYRAAFAVRAPEEAVRQAIDRTQSNLRPRPRRRTAPKLFLAAALIGALLFSSVGAELNSGAVTNLLAPYFGSARTELLEKMGRPVGASASADGYTLTADAIIGDRYNMQIIYTLTRDGGQPIPDNVRFLDVGGSSIAKGNVECSTVFSYPGDSAPNEKRFYQIYRTTGHFSRQIRVSFGRLVVSGDQLEVLEELAAGPWELSFTRRYPDTTRKVPADGLTVTNQLGQSCNISALSYSCMGLNITGILHCSEADTDDGDELFTASVTLKDGTVLPLECGLSAHSSGSNPDWAFRIQARYRDQDGRGLLDTDEIAAITLCDTTIPIE